MTAWIHAEPGWLAAWASKGTSPDEALNHFDSLPGATSAELIDRWCGYTLPTGHPLDGLLEILGWGGKEVLPDGRVHPLLFRRAAGRVIALDPAWMPTGVAWHWPALARSRATRMTFLALAPWLQARGPAARIEIRSFRGQRGAAIIYSRQPIVDHLRRLDADRLLGLMERQGMAVPYFFLLSRDPRH
jgi:hypothetical protein